MEGETRGRVAQGRKEVGSLERIIKERPLSMEVQEGLRDGIVIRTIPYAS